MLVKLWQHRYQIGCHSSQSAPWIFAYFYASLPISTVSSTVLCYLIKPVPPTTPTDFKSVENDELRCYIVYCLLDGRLGWAGKKPLQCIKQQTDFRFQSKRLPSIIARIRKNGYSEANIWIITMEVKTINYSIKMPSTSCFFRWKKLNKISQSSQMN